MDFTITYDFSIELTAARDQAKAVFEDWYEAACTARTITPLADVEDFFDGTADIEAFMASAHFSTAQHRILRKVYDDIIELDKMSVFLMLDTGTAIIQYSLYKWLLEITNQPLPSAADLLRITASY